MNNLITQSTTAGPWIDINTNYLLTSAYLVFFMHCGFAMVGPLSCTPPHHIQQLQVDQQTAGQLILPFR